MKYLKNRDAAWIAMLLAGFVVLAFMFAARNTGDITLGDTSSAGARAPAPHQVTTHCLIYGKYCLGESLRASQS